MWTCIVKYVIYVTHDVNVQNHTEFTIIHYTLYVHTIHVDMYMYNHSSCV